MGGLRRAAAASWRMLRRVAQGVPYAVSVALGRPAGALRFHVLETAEPLSPPWLEVRVPAASLSEVAASAWWRRQTLREIIVVGLAEDGRALWRVGAGGASATAESGSEAGAAGGAPANAGETPEAPWVLVAPALPEGPGSHLDATLLVAAAEAVDGVLDVEGRDAVPRDDLERAAPGQVPASLLPYLVCRRDALPVLGPLGAAEAHRRHDRGDRASASDLRSEAAGVSAGRSVRGAGILPDGRHGGRPLERSDSAVRGGAGDRDAATPSAGSGALLKVIPPEGVAPVYEDRSAYGRRCRGPYRSSCPLGPELSVGIRDLSRLLAGGADDRDRPPGQPLLVLTSFLATGGAEHTLFETLRVLRERFALVLVTLAPHRRERGDRREDFRTISERLYCLGDLVHPAAMAGILLHLIDRYGVRHLYNANGTTLFYELAPQLEAARPELRIVDHLYDHRVGYIDRYTPELRATVDACIAENHRIAEVLVEERGWSRERVPVIWPCGRAEGELPRGERAHESRRRARELFGAREDDVVILTAARMHPQKRPLDLVRLAERFRDDVGAGGGDDGRAGGRVRFVLVGGGDLEEEVDAAIAATNGAPILRLPFRTDVPELIAGADVGCLVSDYEGLPVFLIECLQMGRPFLGTAVGEMGHVLRETGAGIVVETPGDLDALEAAVARLCDPSLRAELGERARAGARRFDVEACAEAYARAFLGEA